MFVSCYMNYKFVSWMLFEKANFYCLTVALRQPATSDETISDLNQ